MKNLKINLHITEKCNFKCKYCFAHFKHTNDLSIDEWKYIIENIKSSNLISAINFAGGEPVLYKGLEQLIFYSKEQGFDVSLISNGSLLLNKQLMQKEMFAALHTLGISVDSFNKNILINLGCCDHQQKVLSEQDLYNLINIAKNANPAIKIKLNTVVSKLNIHEYLTKAEHNIPIDRWKFLKIKAFNNAYFSNLNLLVSDEEFQYFLSRNNRANGEAVAEQTITRSYIMIDNRGNLVDDYGQDYEIIGNLLEEDFTSIFNRYHFDQSLYYSRYKSA